jgi:hypothetical protein
MIKVTQEIIYALCELALLAAFIVATGIWVAKATGKL